jgi:predicted O-linked N-acetylglucosamine transferase (SPINDLY family)
LTGFAQQHVPQFGTRLHSTAAADPLKILRVGWLSPRFSAGPVATFLHGLLAHFDRAGFRHVLIDLAPAVADADAARLHALAHEIVDASDPDDARLLQRLRDLHLDVLVDLAGHSTANRIAVVAQRIAPVQVCWLDWFDSTGIATMDAWISDDWLTPSGSSQRHCEKIVRLHSGRFCYTPPFDSPPPEREIERDEPAGGCIVFASFNRLAKLNVSVIETWAAILQRLPLARLELRARHLGEEETRTHIAQRFAAHGVDSARLALGGALPYHDLLAAYRRVDIALDPFPFSGCTTTCDALWMGCPVITLPGETYVSRQSASLLWRMQRDEWVARDCSDYIERALVLAADIQSLREQRATLRKNVRVQLCDASAQAGDFAAVLHELWRAHCEA